MSSTASAVPSATTSTQSLSPTTGPVSRITTAVIPSAKMKKASDRIMANSCCASFFYNIPRGSVMITLPGIVILIIGAILIATFPKPWNSEWTDGLQLVSLIFLILGGAWTIGGLLFWIGAWFRYRPKKQKDKAPQWNHASGEVDSSSPDRDGLELVRVYRVDGEATFSSNQSLNTNGRVFTVS